jgi:hypothetical protein
MPFLQDDKGNTVTTNLIASKKVVAQLEVFLLSLEAMQKDSPQSKFFISMRLKIQNHPRKRASLSKIKT